jgi:hypothetical protein
VGQACGDGRQGRSERRVRKDLKRGSGVSHSFKHCHNSSSFSVLRTGSRGSCGSGPNPKMGPAWLMPGGRSLLPAVDKRFLSTLMWSNGADTVTVGVGVDPHLPNTHPPTLWPRPIVGVLEALCSAATPSNILRLLLDVRDVSAGLAACAKERVAVTEACDEKDLELCAVNSCDGRDWRV